MRAIFDKNDLTFRLHYHTEIERQQAFTSFNRKIQGWRFKTKNIRGWSGDVQFISNLNKLPVGLWGELKKMCDTYKFPLKVEGFNEFLRNDLDFKHVKQYCDELIETRNKSVPNGKELKLRPYQPQAVYLALKYRLAMCDLSTSAGKTLIMFLYAAYVKAHIDPTAQILIIEPDPEYVIQSYTEINNLSIRSNSNLNIGMVSGQSSLQDISQFDVVIGNFQTLQNREQSFFSRIKFILIDEGHRAKAKSIKGIVKFCVLAKDRIGLSGTVIDDKSAEHYEILAATGPTVIKITKKDLMDQGFAPGIKIRIYVLSYLPDEERRAIAFAKVTDTRTEIAQYEHEMMIIRSDRLRMKWMANLVAQLPKNSITFFIDKQNEYGKRLYHEVRSISQKELFYIDGDTPTKMREEYKSRMEHGNNKGLLATYATYGTGKSINNIHYLVGAEPMKSEVIIGQVLGRGMREHEDKEEFHWIDVVDDFTWEGEMHGEKVYFENILYRQMKDRIKLYKKDKFQYEIVKVKITDQDYKIFLIMEGQALFGPTIKETVNRCRIAFDTHYGFPCIVYLDEHGNPLEVTKDQTPHFLHTLQQWFGHFSKRNKSSTLKIETAQGKGFVLAIAEISQWHVKDRAMWFQLYMEKEGWKTEKGYFKNGFKFEVEGDSVKIISNFGMPNETAISLKIPKDELQINILLDLL